MNSAARLAVVPLGLSLASFSVITYVLCVLFGLFVSDRGMHQLLPFLNPIIAAAAMALSSLSVIVNSALLIRDKVSLT